MEQKTKVTAPEGAQEVWIKREFDLPLNLLFKAYTEPELVAQWMGTKVLKLESKRHGSYQFETTDPKGNAHRFNGTIHEFKPEKQIVRTFEMENTSFPIQLEYLTFEELTPTTSKLIIQIVYKSLSDRDNMLKLPFAFGINMAHDRLQKIVSRLNQE
ncbi:ATPase [Euzebyella marina]|uniref:ATPase n=1 Tax=Euzebyella marina TaxID=1761453 RepID=A0A3G2L5U8_9FLAO|nr:SRPBCC domain-containing protein [Euzebyella marina]AYN67647.1 ATPase [Euzebyella marina]